MCFSATASFTASASLGIIGVAALIKNKNHRAWLLCAVPLIFACQQLVEGLIWVSFSSRPDYVFLLTQAYLFFALLFWPIYVPLMFLMLEPEKIRRKILAVFAAAGAVVGAIIYANYLREPQTAQVLSQCIYYPVDIYQADILRYLYVFIVIGSGLASSRLIAKIFCALVFIGAAISGYFYKVEFTSVWCFFTAIISAIIYFQPQESNAKGAKRNNKKNRKKSG